ncbi:MAG: hypothetical protein ACYSR6_12190 [Planctomycetota bacterium]|jgi:hypothetical protein
MTMTKRVQYYVFIVFYVILQGTPMLATAIGEHYPKSARRALNYLKIGWPVEITEISYYEDGGSTGFTIVDPEEKILLCFFHANRGGKPGQMYLGGRNPSDRNAHPMPLCGIEEMSVLRVVEAYLNAKLTEDEKRMLSETRGYSGINEKQADYRLLLRTVKYRNEICNELLKADS